MLVHTETCSLPLHLLFMFLMPFIYSLLTTPLVLRAIVLMGPTVLGHAMALVPAKAFAHEQHHLSLDGLYVCCTSPRSSTSCCRPAPPAAFPASLFLQVWAAEHAPASMAGPAWLHVCTLSCLLIMHLASNLGVLEKLVSKCQDATLLWWAFPGPVMFKT